jgi:pimeloyl-ACP methyl ester carboxylesterase
LPCGDATTPVFRHVDSTPDTPEEQAALDAAAKAVADDCGRNAGDLLAHVGTDDVVRDMDIIRVALGEEQINYLGISYGSILGLRYAQLFPQNARAIAVDGIIDPTQDLQSWLRHQTIAYAKQLVEVFDACPDGGRGCPPGGAAAAYDEVARRVEVAPIAGQGTTTLGPSELAAAALEPTYDRSISDFFYRALSKALDGDGAPMVELASNFANSVKFVAYAAVECSDSRHPVGSDEYRAFAQELEAISPRFGGAIANELLPCAFWPAPVHDIVGPIAAPGSPPILVIGTTGDAATPYQQAVDVAMTLQNGHLLTVNGDGHAAYGSTCARDAEAAYFVDLTVPAEGASCNR